MLPLIRIKRKSGVGQLFRFIFSFLNIFAVLLCIAFYVMAIIEMGKNKSIDISVSSGQGTSLQTDSQPTDEVSNLPETEENLSYFGDVVKPGLDFTRKMMDARKVNEDTIGWLVVPGTGIDYAVLQYIDNKYYMRLDYDGKWKFAGSIFADFRNLGSTRNDISRNYVIYGHNINTNHDRIRKTDEMFALLMYYKDYEFAKENQHILYSTYEDEMVWEIFSVFYTDVDFYYIDVDPSDDASYEYLINEARLRSEYIYDIDVTTDDKILTLSTCAYRYPTDEEQRFVVMARLVPENEIKLNNVEINPSPKLPDFSDIEW